MLMQVLEPVMIIIIIRLAMRAVVEVVSPGILYILYQLDNWLHISTSLAVLERFFTTVY